MSLPAAPCSARPALPGSIAAAPGRFVSQNGAVAVNDGRRVQQVVHDRVAA
jgi:hypothetical protein